LRRDLAVWYDAVVIATRTAAVIAATLAVLGASLFSARPAASETTPLLPNLQPLRAASLRLETPGDGHTYLRFSTTSQNSGAGPLEIIGGETYPTAGKQQVYQRIYNSDGTYVDSVAGSFEWHAAHGHMHFNDYAIYTLDAVSALGASQRTSVKTTFCIIDTTRMKRVKNAPRQPVYTTCDATVQGMSVGWGDTYGYWLAGQAVDVTGLPDGDYTLTIEVDPKHRIIETNDGDNISIVRLRLAGGRVTVLN
jgi:hypothetical protein